MWIVVGVYLRIFYHVWSTMFQQTVVETCSRRDPAASKPMRSAVVNPDRARRKLEVWGTTVHRRPEELDSTEVWWHERYQRLKTRGYLLRPRYSPGWVPSWTVSNRDWVECEDGKRLRVCKFFPALPDFRVIRGIVRASHRCDSNFGR